MPLSLKISSRATGRSRFVAERTFEEERVTIGRATNCILALDDPDKCLSRVHAEIACMAQGYLLKVMSGTFGASALIGVAAIAAPRLDSTCTVPVAARAGDGTASGRSVATYVPLPMRART